MKQSTNWLLWALALSYALTVTIPPLVWHMPPSGVASWVFNFAICAFALIHGAHRYGKKNVAIFLVLALGVMNIPRIEARAQSVPSGPGFVGPGLEVGEQGLYHLPRDHAFHGGPTWYANEFDDWHYLTFQGTDKKTGHAVTLFWVVSLNGWVKELNRPSLYVAVAWHDTVTGEFVNTTIVPTSKFVTSGTPEPNFGFQYSLNDDADEKGFAWDYDHATERWNFESHSTEKSKIVGSPTKVKLTGVVKAPGYVPMGYWGLENIGYRNGFDQNPETMFGLSYYYTAPEMEMTGTVTLADGVHEIEGVAWFEHQWGNFRGATLRYVWGYARFENGDSITWRQYYDDVSGGKLNKGDTEHQLWTGLHSEQNRFAFIPKGKAPQYAFGPTLLYTPIKWWRSPVTGGEFPWWGELKTPKGTFYLTPTHPAQESMLPYGPFVEGAMLLHKDSFDGPVVARGFTELSQNPSYGGPETRGLPERTDLQFNGGLERK